MDARLTEIGNTDTIFSRSKAYLFYLFLEMLEVISKFALSQQRARPISTMFYGMIPLRLAPELETWISLQSTSTRILPLSMGRHC